MLDSDVIAPGGTVVATATVRNDRPGAVTLGSAWCSSAVDMAARFAIPTEPVGRTWGGIEGEWKEFALTSGLAPGGGPADEGVTIHGTSGPGCDPVERTLGSGESLTVRSLLTADIVDGVPAAPGEVPVEITVLHDPVDPPPRPAPASGPPLPHFGLRMGPTWSQLAVRASIRIEGEAPHVLSLGEAVDALLVDRRFATWLATMPAYTWSVSNVFLGNNGKAEGIAPAGPSWELNLFREAGVARNWAIGFVDPFSGQVLNLAFCNVPCDR